MTDGKDAFESQITNALRSSMRATNALFKIKTALETEQAGGSVNWDRIEEHVWNANESVQFAETYMTDEIGAVHWFKEIDE